MRCAVCLAGLALLGAAATAAADSPPAWLTRAAATQAPAYDADVDSVVLLDEEAAEVDDSGVVRTTRRKAVKILTRAGRSAAYASAIYRTDSAKVRDLRAWMIYPSGKHESFGKKETVDLALAENDVYNEARVRAISGRSAADPGAVFGFESVVEDRSIFTQFLFQFQGASPVIESRFSLKLPAGWTAEGNTFNRDPIEPQTEGSRWTWTLRDLPPISYEPARPSLTALAPRIAVSYFPSESASGLGPSFEAWEEVSAWLAALSDPQAVPDAAVEAKARELTASATTELGRIAALADYAQDVRYISIQTGLGRGGGYQPHPAAEVFANAYGDCKDKANLLRAMLSVVGIDSYPVAVYSGDRRFVRPEWASPQQFNHAILAIRVSDKTDTPAVAEVEGLGRLLFFDPTDPYTPVGLLPGIEQGSWGLVVSAVDGRLVQLPAVAPEDNRVEREVELRLSEDGSVEGEIREVAAGDAAADNRRLRESSNEADYRDIIERWVTRGAPGAEVSEIAAEDEGDVFRLDVKLSAERYGQSMGGRLIVFKPAIVSRRNYTYFTEEERTHPIELRSNAFQEVVTVTLPEGFSVDERPQDVESSTDFGLYRAAWEPGDGRLVFRRSLEVRNAVVDPDGYEDVRAFYNAIVNAEQSPVVLVKE